ncbi:hypothetical protein ACKFKG_11235 [Phormidesmis sp. 146-35]
MKDFIEFTLEWKRSLDVKERSLTIILLRNHYFLQYPDWST